MAVDVTTTPTFKAGRPSVLFRLSEETPVTATMANVGRDGERVLIAVPPPQLAQRGAQRGHRVVEISADERLAGAVENFFLGGRADGGCLRARR